MLKDSSKNIRTPLDSRRQKLSKWILETGGRPSKNSKDHRKTRFELNFYRRNLFFFCQYHTICIYFISKRINKNCVGCYRVAGEEATFGAGNGGRNGRRTGKTHSHGNATQTGRTQGKNRDSLSDSNTVRRHICCLFKTPKTCQHIGCFVNICDAALYILLLEGQKGVNIWGVVNICDAGQYWRIKLKL